MASKKYVNFFLKWSTYIVCTNPPPPPPFLLESRVSYQIFKKGGLIESQFLEVARKEEEAFSAGGGIVIFT